MTTNVIRACLALSSLTSTPALDDAGIEFLIAGKVNGVPCVIAEFPVTRVKMTGGLMDCCRSQQV